MAKSNPIELAAEIVAAFVSNNPLPKSDLPALIQAMHSAVERLAAPESAPPQVEAKAPAVSIRRSITPDFLICLDRRSITPDFLICLDDGNRFKSLRRHLTTLGMTPAQYRPTIPWSRPTMRRIDPSWRRRSDLARFGGKAGARKN
jgi:predicted transcriptional regulator